jgi:uncharacterized membrane protein YjjB (DUF3815 family)
MDIIYDLMIPCALSFLSCMGFGVQFNVRRKNLLAASIGAVVCKAVDLVLLHQGIGEVRACFLATTALAIYSEVLARLFRSPVTMYLIVGIIPVVPGSAVFYTMQSLVMGDHETFLERCIDSFEIAGAIAMGIFIAPAIIKLWKDFRYEHMDDVKQAVKNVSTKHDRSIKKI